MYNQQSLRYLELAIIMASIAVCINIFMVIRSIYSTVNEAPVVKGDSLGSSHLVAGRIVPDSKLTPGSTNPAITQANYKQTLCNPSWHTGSIRPSSSYTSALKLKQITQYGYDDTDPSHYEEDHLISLELGGNPTDPKNLWPQSYLVTPSAKNKDAVESYLHSELCKGHYTLQQVQGAIKGNWTTVYAYMLTVAPLGSIQPTGFIQFDDDDETF